MYVYVFKYTYIKSNNSSRVFCEQIPRLFAAREKYSIKRGAKLGRPQFSKIKIFARSGFNYLAHTGSESFIRSCTHRIYIYDARCVYRRHKLLSPLLMLRASQARIKLNNAPALLSKWNKQNMCRPFSLVMRERILYKIIYYLSAQPSSLRLFFIKCLFFFLRSFFLRRCFILYIYSTASKCLSESSLCACRLYIYILYHSLLYRWDHTVHKEYIYIPPATIL